MSCIFKHGSIFLCLLLRITCKIYVSFPCQLIGVSFTCFILYCVSLQLRESISQDQEKTESLKGQLHEVEASIQNVDTKIHHTEVTLKDLRKLQEQIAVKSAERGALFKEQQKQYAALAEENEGLYYAKYVLHYLFDFG